MSDSFGTPIALTPPTSIEVIRPIITDTDTIEKDKTGQFPILPEIVSAAEYDLLCRAKPGMRSATGEIVFALFYGNNYVHVIKDNAYISLLSAFQLRKMIPSMEEICFHGNRKNKDNVISAYLPDRLVFDEAKRLGLRVLDEEIPPTSTFEAFLALLQSKNRPGMQQKIYSSGVNTHFNSTAAVVQHTQMPDPSTAEPPPDTAPKKRGGKRKAAPIEGEEGAAKPKARSRKPKAGPAKKPSPPAVEQIDSEEAEPVAIVEPAKPKAARTKMTGSRAGKSPKAIQIIKEASPAPAEEELDSDEEASVDVQPVEAVAAPKPKGKGKGKPAPVPKVEEDTKKRVAEGAESKPKRKKANPDENPANDALREFREVVEKRISGMKPSARTNILQVDYSPLVGGNKFKLDQGIIGDGKLMAMLCYLSTQDLNVKLLPAYDPNLMLHEQSRETLHGIAKFLAKADTEFDFVGLCIGGISHKAGHTKTITLYWEPLVNLIEDFLRIPAGEARKTAINNFINGLKPEEKQMSGAYFIALTEGTPKVIPPTNDTEW